jgi:Na+/H+-dicarboxylate symporter
MRRSIASRFLSFLGTTRAIVFGIVMGVVLGFVLQERAEALKPIGTIFISLLKLVVIPLVFASIAVGVHRTGNMARLGRLGLRTVIYYLVTTSFSILVGMVLVNLLKPGVGVTLEASGFQPVVQPSDSFTSFLMRLVPDNIVAAFAEMNILGIILFALILGVALIFAEEKGKPLVHLLQSTEEVLLILTRGIIRLVPIGVIGLIAPLIGTFGFSIFASFSKFVCVVLAGLTLHACITIPLIFRTFSNRPLKAYFSSVKKALLSAFATSSSSATLPISLECAREAGIDDETSSFVLPLGATINMDGTALYEAVIAIFIAQSLGIDLSGAQQFTIYLTATLASIGAAGIPSAGLVTILLVLEAVGLPAVGLGVLFAIDRPLDMCRTTVNVWGDLVGCAVVEEKKKKRVKS